MPLNFALAFTKYSERLSRLANQTSIMRFFVQNTFHTSVMNLFFVLMHLYKKITIDAMSWRSFEIVARVSSEAVFEAKRMELLFRSLIDILFPHHQKAEAMA